MKKITGFLLFLALTAVLFTVCINDPFLWQGIITGKYFWFAGAVGAVSLIYAVFSFCKEESVLRLTDIPVMLAFIYIIVNFVLLNNRENMHWWLFLLMIPLYFMVRSVCETENIRIFLTDAIIAFVLIESVWGLLQLYGFAYTNHGLYKITGSLFNPGPYSGFVAVGVPLALSYSLTKELPQPRRWLGIATLSASLLVLPAAMSRAAWIAAIAGSLPVLWQYGKTWFSRKDESKGETEKQPPVLVSLWQKRGIRTIFVTILCASAVGIFAGMYWLKKDSADGRWLIWRVSAGIIKEHPMSGTGYGSFAANYGNAQAEFFLSGKGTETQIMVADSPDYAFNEYVQITVELGIIGLILFLAILYSLFPVKTKKTDIPIYGKRNVDVRPALLSFLVFAAFSYPFSVLPLSIVFVFLLAIAASSSSRINVRFPAWVNIIPTFVCLGISLYGTCNILPKRAAYREWTSLQTIYRAEVYTRAVKDYRELFPALKHEKQFLFEYGQCLSKTEEYEESNKIFEQFLHYDSDPMVYNCMGNNYKSMGEYDRAEKMYFRASQIVPNRHYPLYLLMKMYDETGQKSKAREMAEKLLNKPVKVQSTAIREMQQEAKEVMSDELK